MSKPVIKYHVIDTVFLEQMEDLLRILALEHLSIDRLPFGNIISGTTGEIRRAKEYFSTRKKNRVAGKSISEKDVLRFSVIAEPSHQGVPSPYKVSSLHIGAVANREEINDA